MERRGRNCQRRGCAGILHDAKHSYIWNAAQHEVKEKDERDLVFLWELGKA